MTRPKMRYVGADGNVFSIIARASKALKQAGRADEAKEYRDRVTACTSYDEALMLTLSYVDEEVEDEEGVEDDDDLVWNRREDR